MARVNLNIAITAMVVEKPPHGNHSLIVCERALRASSNEFNSTQSEKIVKTPPESDTRDTFDWTNRQSGLMLGTRADRTDCIELSIVLNGLGSPEKVDITMDTQQ